MPRKVALPRFNQRVVETDSVTYASLLRWCGNENDLSEGKRIHADLLKNGLERDKFLGNLLLEMYGNCGLLEDARACFVRMRKRDLFSWNCIIKATARNGLRKEALQLFAQMQLEGLIADRLILIAVLAICASETALFEGQQIHSCITNDGLESDIVLGTTLVNMYGKCGSVNNAMKTFDRMLVHDAISWTAMIAVYAQHKVWNEACRLFDQMQQEGIIPDTVTFVSILDACASQEAIPNGKRMHARIVRSAIESDVVVGTALVNMYGKCGNLEYARGLFHIMIEQNMVSWNTLLAVYAQNGWGKDALNVFEQMQQEAVLPNKVTFVSVCDACASLLALSKGRQAHACIWGSGFESDVIVSTALVNMYGKCEDLKSALMVFNDMPEHDVVSLNAMITAYAQHGQVGAALQLFDQMQYDGITPDRVTFISVLSSCGNQAALAEGKCVHDHVKQSEFDADATVANALIGMYCQCGSLEEAYKVFDQMTQWDEVTFVSILSGCASNAALCQGKYVHQQIMVSGVGLDLFIGNALINLYSKCGSLQDAGRIFEDMPEQDLISWTAMIAGYAQLGNGKDAVQFFHQMQQEKLIPNEVTFMSVLSACSHAGLLEEGSFFFNSMTQDYDITPNVDHYNCMVDLLGRLGQLQEAETLISNMPVQPTMVSWNTLLGACRVLLDVERGERAAMSALHLDPRNIAPYVMLANIYAAAGKLGDAINLMDRVKGNSRCKQSGRGSMEVKGELHKFHMDHQLYPERGKFYADLQELNIHSKEEEYVPHMSNVRHCQEGKEHLCSPSENPALAFGLISIPDGLPICFTNNKPVCPGGYSAKPICKLIQLLENLIVSITWRWSLLIYRLSLTLA